MILRENTDSDLIIQKNHSFYFVLKKEEKDKRSNNSNNNKENNKSNDNKDKKTITIFIIIPKEKPLTDTILSELSIINNDATKSQNIPIMNNINMDLCAKNWFSYCESNSSRAVFINIPEITQTFAQEFEEDTVGLSGRSIEEANK